MLNLNSKAHSEQQQQDCVWKVLVYDQFGQEIIAPLLRISDLRENSITVHMLLNADRQAIPDVPVVYFVAPTRENIARICDDLSRRLYESYYINFSSAVSRDLLETMAEETIQSDTSAHVAQVYDQYLNYLCLETNMFSLGLLGSYFKLNNPLASDSDIDVLIKQIVNGLYSVFVTTGQVPVIRAARGGAAEMVAQSLDAKLRDYVRNSMLTSQAPSDNLLSSSQRPVLILTDRNIDLSVMLRHTWSYQCLAHDVLEMTSNRIAYFVDENGRNMKKVYDLAINDFFWARNASAPFPQMAADVDAELSKYKKEVNDITRSCGVSSLEEISQSDANSSARSLKAAISALPVLTEKKRTIDMHMNIAHALLEKIKQRSLDAFIVTEESISKQNRASIAEILTSDKGTPEDKLRLLVVYYLQNDQVQSDEMAEHERALSALGCDLSSLSYIKNIRAVTNMAHFSMQPAAQKTASSSLFGGLSKITGIKDSAFGSAIDSLYSGVKNILPTRQNLAIVRMVEAIMEAQGKAEEEFAYFDPKQMKQQRMRHSSTFQDAYVFVVGGGNYVEYQNLQEYEQSSGKRITYGATEILNAYNFLEQLSKLGSK